MNQSYKTLSRNIEARLNPDALNESTQYRVFNKAFSDTYDDPDEFIHNAMKSVGPDYTKVSLEAGSMVKQHLKTVLTDVDYEYQGSVMTNTHVKGRSDIDLVCLSNRFYTYDRAEIIRRLETDSIRRTLSTTTIEKYERERSIGTYTGNPLEDLREIRYGAEEKLSKTYDTCNVVHPKAIKIRNQNLHRDVDIVTASWYDDANAIQNDRGSYRGIQVYNKDTDSREPADYPFLSIKRINDRGEATTQRSKKMVRFLKNMRDFSELEIKLSSFDINAICYDINTSLYIMENERGLVRVLYGQIQRICTDDAYADRLLSVDGHCAIYADATDREDKLANLRKLMGEIYQVVVDINKPVNI